MKIYNAIWNLVAAIINF